MECSLDQLEALEQTHDLEDAQNLDDSQQALVPDGIRVGALQAFLRNTNNQFQMQARHWHCCKVCRALFPRQ